LYLMHVYIYIYDVYNGKADENNGNSINRFNCCNDMNFFNTT